MTTIDVGQANATAEVTKDFSITYADLKKSIVINGNALPDDESLLPIGDS
jgi:hypothetical protein